MAQSPPTRPDFTGLPARASVRVRDVWIELDAEGVRVRRADVTDAPVILIPWAALDVTPAVPPAPPAMRVGTMPSRDPLADRDAADRDAADRAPAPACTCLVGFPYPLPCPVHPHVPGR